MEIRSILYIDDDTDDQEFFQIALRSVNGDISLHTAKNGLDAFDKLGNMASKPGLIFLDLNMPLMDGKQFLGKIKNDPQLKHIPIAIYTTSSAITDKEQAMQMGASYFITKPNKINDIARILEKVIPLPGGFLVL